MGTVKFISLENIRKSLKNLNNKLTLSSKRSQVRNPSETWMSVTVLVNLLTNIITQSLPYQIKSRSAGHKIPRFYGTQKFTVVFIKS